MHGTLPGGALTVLLGALCAYGGLSESGFLIKFDLERCSLVRLGLFLRLVLLGLPLRGLLLLARVPLMVRDRGDGGGAGRVEHGR
ncbi:hypothetical protein [Streptomyces microflavus]|uniref:Uncharacterized protein n=1 Tax=Streptomyces microflavus TaxID=1919 RepID=A0A7H8N0G7_STRMI|nr:hypothetical protein [Streptomyces microflavus]QKW47940.1 hypothetical protein HUT09_36115 [Streptomyces microflavus]